MTELMKRIRLEDAIKDIAMGPFGSNIKAENFVEAGVPVLRGQNLNEFYVTHEPLVFLTEEKADTLSRSIAHAGDIVITHRGTLGQVSMIPRKPRFDRYVVSQSQMRLTLDESVLLPEFFVYWIRSAEGQHELLGFSSQTGVPSLAQPTASIKKLAVPLPSPAVQKSIADVLGSLDDKIAANEIVIHRCEGLIQTITLTATNSTHLRDLAKRVTKATKPSELGGDTVLHYSLPAYDRGSAALERVDSIKSSKFAIENPCVLVSKLNPNVPRAWCVPKVDQDYPSVASTEFVVLEPLNCSVGQLYAASIQPAFFKHLESLTGGTSKSHQRVLPEEMLESEVPDTRTLGADEIALLDSLVLLQQQLVEENAALARTRDELLPLLMSGKISVAGASESSVGAGVEELSEGMS